VVWYIFVFEIELRPPCPRWLRLRVKWT